MQRELIGHDGLEFGGDVAREQRAEHVARPRRELIREAIGRGGLEGPGVVAGHRVLHQG